MKKSIFLLLITMIFISCGETNLPKEYSTSNKNIVKTEKTTVYKLGFLDSKTLYESNVIKITIVNNTESPIKAIRFREENKKEKFSSVNLPRGEYISYEFTKGTSCEIELIDEKNHHYRKGNNSTNIEENMHIFNTNLDMEIVFTDKDFKPIGLMDFLFKFFGM